MKNRELINALIEHYRDHGDEEVELLMHNGCSFQHFSISHTTENHVLILKETGGYCSTCNHYMCDHGTRGCNIEGCGCKVLAKPEQAGQQT